MMCRGTPYFGPIARSWRMSLSTPAVSKSQCVTASAKAKSVLSQACTPAEAMFATAGQELINAKFALYEALRFETVGFGVGIGIVMDANNGNHQCLPWLDSAPANPHGFHRDACALRQDWV